MTYSPGLQTAVPPMIGPFTFGVASGALERFFASTPSSATYTSASRAFYYPVLVPGTCVVYRVWWANGATTTGGATIEVGVYADAGGKPGAKLVSGSATQGTASQVQFVDVTDTAIAPGRYWVAVVASSTTNTTMFRTVAPSTAFDAVFVFEQASASPLPSTATPVEASFSIWYLCGFATTASP